MTQAIDPQWAWAPYRPSDDSPWDVKKVGHLHRRAAFGASWSELEEGLKAGPEKAIDDLLKADAKSVDGHRLKGRLLYIMADDAAIKHENSKAKESLQNAIAEFKTANAWTKHRVSGLPPETRRSRRRFNSSVQFRGAQSIARTSPCRRP